MRSKIFIPLIALGMVMAVAGVGYAYEEGNVKDGGTIKGEVKFIGNPPKLAPVKVTKNQDVCGASKPSEALTVSAKGGVKYAIGYLEGITQGKKYERKETLLNQEKCVFRDHVFAMVKGTDLSTKNSDPVLHNANMAVDGRQMFNFGQPKKEMVITKRVRRTGEVDITCDSHTHMRAYFLVFDHPYFAVTDDEGAFTIDNIPPGKYTLKLWHESWKIVGHDDDGRPLYDKPIVLTKEVVVPAKGEVRVSFELK